MGSSLVVESPPKHIVSLKYDLHHRGWEQTALSRGIPISYVAKVHEHPDDQLTRIALKTEDYENPSITSINEWGLLIHWSDEFPMDEKTFIGFTKELKIFMQCTGESIKKINNWIQEIRKKGFFQFSLIMENEKRILVVEYSESEQVYILWAIRIHQIIAPIEKNGNGIKETFKVSPFPLHEKIPVLIVRKNGCITDVIVCETKAMRIKYKHIYFHKMKI